MIGKICVCTLCLGVYSSGVFALDTDPFDFVPAPVGTNLSILYYDHNFSNKFYSKGDKLPVDVTADVFIGRFVKYVDIGGYTVAPQILIPAASLEMKSGGIKIDNSGIGDPIIAAPFWFYNNPDDRNYFAIAPYLFMPFGDYENNNPLSIGENRWKLVIQPGFSYGVGDNWTFDFIADVQISGENSKLKMKQKALFSVQPQITYHTDSGSNWSVGAYHYWGGETKLDNVSQDNEID